VEKLKTLKNKELCKMPELLKIFSNKKIKIIEKPKVFADYREKNSLVIASLMNLGCEVEVNELKIGDYIAQNVIIERKTVTDFVSSMINKRLINQLENLKQFEYKLLIIEGIEELELYNDHNIQGMYSNSIRGFLLSISLKHKVPILFSKNSADTARYIYLIAKKQEKEMSTNTKKKAKNKKEQMQFILEGFPGIGPKAAKKLLKDFKSLKKIFNATEEELKNSIGKKAEIFRILEEKD